MIHFRCPRCGVRLKGRTGSAGHKRTCPSCGSKVRVPYVTGTPEAWNPDGVTPPSRDAVPHSESTRNDTIGSSVLIATPSQEALEDCSFLCEPRCEGELGRLGPFRILEVLGAGSTGIVFRAEDTQLRRPVALKVLRPAIAASAESRRRFIREARAAAAFDHENILTIYQVGEDRSIPWMAMKLLRGQSLKDRISGESLFLPPDQAVRIGAEVADALAVAHAGGIVHRDVKPSNILLEDGNDRVKLIDFGLVLVEDEEGQLTRTGCVVGTPAYMAPEQADGAPVDGRSDLYGLGCVLYRSLTGKLPFEGSTYMQVFYAQRTQTPVCPRQIKPDLPSDLSELVMHLMEKDPAARPQTALAVRDALRALQAQPVALQAQPDAPPAPLAPPVPPADPKPASRALTQTLVSIGTDELPALPPEPPAGNPWADVMIETIDPPAATDAPADQPARSIFGHRSDPRLRWLWFIAAASVGLLLAVILLALRG